MSSLAPSPSAASPSPSAASSAEPEVGLQPKAVSPFASEPRDTDSDYLCDFASSDSSTSPNRQEPGCIWGSAFVRAGFCLTTAMRFVDAWAKEIWPVIQADYERLQAKRPAKQEANAVGAHYGPKKSWTLSHRREKSAM